MIHVDLQVDSEAFLRVPPCSSPSTTTGNSQFQQTTTGGNNTVNTAMYSMDEEAGEGRTTKMGPNNAEVSFGP